MVSNHLGFFLFAGLCHIFRFDEDIKAEFNGNKIILDIRGLIFSSRFDEFKIGKSSLLEYVTVIKGKVEPGGLRLELQLENNLREKLRPYLRTFR